MYVGISWGMNHIPSITTDSKGTSPTQYILKTTFMYGSLYLLAQVLIPPQHKPTSSWYPLCPRSHLIYGTEIILRLYGSLPPLDKFLDRK